MYIYIYSTYVTMYIYIYTCCLNHHISHVLRQKPTFPTSNSSTELIPEFWWNPAQFQVGKPYELVRYIYHKHPPYFTNR